MTFANVISYYNTTVTVKFELTKYQIVSKSVIIGMLTVFGQTIISMLLA